MIKTSKKIYHFLGLLDPLKIGQICCPETSLITNQHRVTSHKSENLEFWLNLRKWTWQFYWHNLEMPHNLLRSFCSVWAYRMVHAFPTLAASFPHFTVFFFSSCKAVLYDVWVRRARHNYLLPPFSVDNRTKTTGQPLPAQYTADSNSGVAKPSYSITESIKISKPRLLGGVQTHTDNMRQHLAFNCLKPEIQQDKTVHKNNLTAWSPKFNKIKLCIRII